MLRRIPVNCPELVRKEPKEDGACRKHAKRERTLKLFQIDPLNVELIVPASQFGSFDVGTMPAVSPRPPGVGTYYGEIELIDPIIEASSGTFGVRAKLPNPDLEITAGRVCDVAISGT